MENAYEQTLTETDLKRIHGTVRNLMNARDIEQLEEHEERRRYWGIAILGVLAGLGLGVIGWVALGLL